MIICAANVGEQMNINQVFLKSDHIFTQEELLLAIIFTINSAG
jgi:hypothetical protein